MAHQDIYNLAFGSEALKARAVGACLASAYYVLAEDPGTANHTSRLAWALDIITNPLGIGTNTYYLMLQSPTIQSAGEASTDGNLDAIMATILGNSVMLAALGYT